MNNPVFWQLFGLFGAFFALWGLATHFAKMIQRLPEQTAEKLIEKLREEENRKLFERNSDPKNE